MSIKSNFALDIWRQMRYNTLAMSEIAHYRRFGGYDYSRGAALFITITTKPRRQVFGAVVDGAMALSALGHEALASMERVFNTEALVLHGHVVMPDHVHLSLYLKPGLEHRAAIRTLNTAVGKFKSWINRCYWQIGGEGALWQHGYHDWLCLDRGAIEAVERYIAYNPLKWELRNNRGLLRMMEPLNARCLTPGEYWRGVGAVELLASKRPLVALRVSRHNSEEQLAALVQYLAPQLGKITVLSGFISPGERQILDLLLQRQDTKIIKVSPYALPHDYSPGVALMPAIEAGHLAIIAKGNSPAEISRAACLDLNAAIAKIAAKAIYWRNGAAITPPI